MLSLLLFFATLNDEAFVYTVPIEFDVSKGIVLEKKRLWKLMM